MKFDTRNLQKFTTAPYAWLRGVVARMSDSRLAVVGSNPGHGIAGFFRGR